MSCAVSTDYNNTEELISTELHGLTVNKLQLQRMTSNTYSLYLHSQCDHTSWVLQTLLIPTSLPQSPLQGKTVLVFKLMQFIMQLTVCTPFYSTHDWRHSCTSRESSVRQQPIQCNTPTPLPLSTMFMNILLLEHYVAYSGLASSSGFLLWY